MDAERVARPLIIPNDRTPMSDKEQDKDIHYRGGELTEEDQQKIKEEADSHKDDVDHIQYRGAEDDVKLHADKEKHKEHIKYRGAEDDVDI